MENSTGYTSGTIQIALPSTTLIPTRASDDKSKLRIVYAIADLEGGLWGHRPPLLSYNLPTLVVLHYSIIL